MSNKAEIIRDLLNEKWDEFSSELFEILDYGELEEDPWLVVNFEDGTSVDLRDNYSSNHIDGDGGDMAHWVTFTDDGVDYHVGIKGTYSSWGGDHWDRKFKIGKVRTWTESMFE